AAVQAGGLELLAEDAVDVGDRDHFLADAGGPDLLTIDHPDFRDAVDIDDRHRLADVLAGEVEHALATGGVQRDRHRWRAALRVDTRGGTDQLVARSDHALVEQDRHRLAVRAELLA